MDIFNFVYPGPLVGFVWRRIPTISQHKLGLESLCPESFERWSSLFLNRYDVECVQYEKQLIDQTTLLEQEGVVHTYVAPEAIGSIKLKVVQRLISELIPGTFILVRTWADLGSSSIVEEIVTAASSQNRFFILPLHKSLMHMQPADIKQAHKSWVIDTLPITYVASSSRRDQILALQEKGWSAEEIQVELGMSKSTYYRLLDATSPIVNKATQVKELLEQGKTPAEIQAILGISSHVFYRITTRMMFNNPSGIQVSPKPE